MKKSGKKRNLISLLFTLFIIGMLILSGPVSAITVSITADKSTYTSGDDTVTLSMSINIQNGEHIPIQNLTLSINPTTGNASEQCSFTPSGSAITSCPNIAITAVSVYQYENSTGYGYGYGYDYASQQWGYNTTNFYDGYGYGYGYGYSNTYANELSYTITWNITSAAAGNGNYEALLDAYAQLGSTIFIYRSETPASFAINMDTSNIAPVINASIPVISTPEDTAATIDLSNYESDNEDSGTSLSWSISSINSTLYSASINMTTDVLTITPEQNQFGIDTAILTLTDSGSLTDTQMITINISSVNDLPVMAGLPAQSISEDQNPPDNWIDLYDYVSDVEDNDSSMIYTIAAQTNTTLISCSISSSRYVNCTDPTSNLFGTSDITAKAIDTSGAQANKTFTITVNPVNDAPIISGSAAGLPGSRLEDTEFNLTLTAYISDPETATANLIISENSSYATTTGQVIIFNYPDGVTSEAVKISVSDGQLSASETITVTSTPVNDIPTAPVIDLTPDSAAASQTLTCSVTEASSDPDNSTIYYNYSWYRNSVLNQSSYTTAASTTLQETTAGSEKWACYVFASDGIGSSSALSDFVTIGNTVPTSPSINLVPNVAYTSSDLICNVTSNSTDADSDTITYRYEWRKEGVVMSGLNTSVLSSGNTSKGELWKCTVRADDSNSLSAITSTSSDSVTISNSKPSINTFSPTNIRPSITETQTQAFNISYTDLDSDAVSITWYKDSASVGTGISYTYTPTSTSSGTHTIKVVVSDGSLTASKTWVLTVTDVNKNPLLPSIADQSVNELESFYLDIDATDTDEDNSLRYYDNSTLFTINPTTGVISFTPAESKVGTYSLNIIVMDDKGGMNSSAFTLTVNNVNKVPVLAPIGLLTAVQDTAFTYTVSATDQDSSDTITYSDNTSLFDIGSSTGVISFTPNSSHVGTSMVRITATDGAASDFEDISFTVLAAANRGPSITTYYPASLAPSITEAASQTFNVSTTDADGTTPSTVWYLNSSVVSLTDSYTYTPTYTSAGSYNVTVVVSDGLVNNITQWNLTVADSNRAPSITAITDQTATEDQSFSYRVVATDADTDNILVFSDNSSLFTTGLLTGTISFTPTNDDVGTHSVMIFVADGTVKVNTSFTLTVSNVNDAPVLASIGSQTLVEDTAFSLTVSATDQDSSDTITYTDDTGLFDISSSTGVISFTPTYQESGTYLVRITAKDSSGAEDFEDVSFTVLNTNIAPSITSYYPSLSNPSIKEDNETTFNITYSDADGTTPSVQWYLDGNAVTGEVNDKYTFEGDFTDAGTNAGNHTITAMISDGLATDSQSWTLTVNRTRDSDGDLVPDYKDNCYLVYNPDQTDNNPGTPEGLVCENNIDGDDVEDDVDYILGDAENLETNLDNMKFEIAGSEDLNQIINQTQTVAISVTNYSTETGAATVLPIIEFTFSFTNTTKLTLSNVTVKKQPDTASTGSMLVRGIDLATQSKTKTVYMDQLEESIIAACIKDADIDSISEISSACTGANETLITCTAAGFTSGAYTCTDVGSRFKLEGLSYSGVQQQACVESWSCGSWTSCSGGAQTRTCTEANSCGTTDDQPATSQSCSDGRTASTAPASNRESSTGQVWESILAGQSVTLNVNKENMPLTKIKLTVNNKVSNAEIKVYGLKAAPSTSQKLSGKIFRYLELFKEGVPDSSVESVEISFRVEKAWLAEQGLSGVSLYRYVSGGWTELLSEKVSGGDTYIYYKATSPGLSYFAIGEKRMVSAELTAFDLIDMIRNYYAKKSSYTAFQIIDMIRDYYKS